MCIGITYTLYIYALLLTAQVSRSGIVKVKCYFYLINLLENFGITANILVAKFNVYYRILETALLLYLHKEHSVVYRLLIFPVFIL